jgi:hypothetical protein
MRLRRASPLPVSASRLRHPAHLGATFRRLPWFSVRDDRDCSKRRKTSFPLGPGSYLDGAPRLRGARGFIYILIGGNALAATAGGQKPHGFTEGLQAIGNAPLRAAVALVLLAGLGCFAGYFLIRGFRDLARQRGKRHRFAAAGLIGDAAIYIGFVAALAGATLGGQGGEGQTQSWFAWAMHLPFGRVLLGLVGVVICGCSLAYLAWGLLADLERDLSLPPSEKRLFQPVARYGIGGRGVAIAFVGAYWLMAAINANPSQAHQLGQAMQDVRSHAYGWVLLLALGLAFVASASFDLVEAVFRKRES